MSKFSSLVIMVGLGMMLALAAACAPAPAPAPAPTAAPQATSMPAPATTEPNAPVGIVTATPPSSEAQAPSALAAAPMRLNLNTASPEEFLALPNVDSSVVSEFQQARPYASVLDFRNAMGRYFDPSAIATFEEYVFVPIDVNAADAATLEQIPGVTPEIAAELIAGRPYGTNQNFLAKLVTLVSAEDTLKAQELLAP